MPGKKRKSASAAKPKPEAKAKAKSQPSSGPAAISHWLIKSEPESRIEHGQEMKFGLADLKAEPDQTACWDGVRNYAARNHMRAMRVGQRAFFYHSNCKEPGIAGLVTVVKEAYPDHTQFDPKDAHYDPKSKREEPRWDMVDVKFERELRRYVTLKELKALHLAHKAAGKGELKGLALFTSARLSVQPVTDEEFDFILALEDQEPEEPVEPSKKKAKKN